MGRQGKELKYPLADARGSVVLPNPKIVRKKQEVSAQYYEWDPGKCGACLLV
jgi:hypothetical protein